MNHRARPETRTTQAARIVDLLRSRSPEWVPLPEILELRISQYSARIHQARHKWGLPIENRVENVNGKKHSWFRLVQASAIASKALPSPCKAPLLFTPTPQRWADPEEGAH